MITALIVIAFMACASGGLALVIAGLDGIVDKEATLIERLTGAFVALFGLALMIAPAAIYQLKNSPPP